MAEIALGGGGSTEQICAPGPQDTIQIFDNILSRLTELEKIVSQMSASNILANQLSDLSQQVGWLYNVEYMGLPGWTQTEYGTLIPPAGFTFLGSGLTLSDGNTYQAVMMDSDGALQFGFKPDGNIEGNLAPSDDYIVMNTLSGSPGGNVDLGSIIVQRGNAFTFNGSDTVVIHEKGIYAYSLIINGSSADLNDTETFYAAQQFGYPFSYTTAGVWGAVVDEDGDFYIGATVIGIVTSQPCNFRVQWNGANDPLAGIIDGSLTVIKLQNIV